MQKPRTMPGLELLKMENSDQYFATIGLSQSNL